MNREDFKKYVASEFFGLLSKNGFILDKEHPNILEEIGKTSESIYMAAKKLVLTEDEAKMKRFIGYPYAPELDTIEGYFYEVEKYRLKNACTYFEAWVYVERTLKELGKHLRFDNFYDFSVSKSRYVTMQNNELSRI